jgi:hypothetical protein
VKLLALNRERLIEFGRKRAKQGAGPATLSIDLSFIRTIITHAAAVHGIEVSAEEARLARVALSHFNLVGRSNERDRRPTQDELDELIEYFETNRRQFIPMGRSVRYAVATTLRQEEIWTSLSLIDRRAGAWSRGHVCVRVAHDILGAVQECILAALTDSVLLKILVRQWTDSISPHAYRSRDAGHERPLCAKSGRSTNFSP